MLKSGSYESFKEFVNSREPDEPICHTKGWLGCAVGAYTRLQEEDPIERLHEIHRRVLSGNWQNSLLDRCMANKQIIFRSKPWLLEAYMDTKTANIVAPTYGALGKLLRMQDKGYIRDYLSELLNGYNKSSMPCIKVEVADTHCSFKELIYLPKQKVDKT